MDALKETMDSVSISRKERYSRCVALEEDYVRQVYEKIGNDLAQAKDPLEEIVTDFLDELEPGSLVADIGCGNGKHLRDKNGIVSIGVDSSSLQTSLSRQRCQEAILGDNLRLPFRGNAFDAVLSIGVIHHFTTRERRIQALTELARILKIGGKVLIAVQKHNTQTSKDVLVPWFDVPNEKSLKGKQSFEEDRDEYEIEDYEKDEDDEDSISLPSSDEEDSPLINHAKIFPPKTNFAKQDWNSKRQSRSLDNDYETSSNSEPNQKQLVQTNACYAFVRNAFKRFSSVSSAESDTFFEPECDRRVDFAVQLSPTTSQEQKSVFPLCSFFNLNERMARTICDNYIELLNFDCGQDKFSSLSKADSLYDAVCKESSNVNPSINTKRNLIHSLSGIFKNVDSLWSSKGAKSCSDLKKHTIKEGRNILKHKDDRNRLVRSRTIATCKSDFSFESQLEDVEENDMTICEANKIINDFLESSMPMIETLRTNENVSGSKKLTHYDIMNGNTLTPIDGTAFNRKYNSDELGKKRSSVKQTNEEEENYFLKEKYDKSLNNKHKNFLSEKKFESIIETHEPYPEIFFLSETVSKTQKMHFSNKYNNDFSHMDDQCELNMKNKSNSRSEIEAQLREKYSFLFDDIDNYELSKIKAEDPLFRKDAKTNFKNSVCDMVDEKEYEVLILDNKYCSELKNDSSKIHQRTQKDSFSNNENLFSSETSLNVDITAEKNRILSNQTSFSSVKAPLLNQQDMEYKENLNFNSENCNIDSNSLLHKNPKRFQESNSNQTAQMLELKKLGPFYEEDEKCFSTYKNPSLYSYYSMPELNALSEFYHEYCIYQTNSSYNRIVEPSNIQASFHEKSLDVYSIVHKDNINIDHNFQTLPQSNSAAMDPKQYELNTTVEDHFSDGKDIFNSCNSLQYPFQKPISSFSQIQLDNSDSMKEIYSENKNEIQIDFRTFPKEISPESNNHGLIQQICEVDAEKLGDRRSNYIFHQPLSWLSRSHSVSNLLETSNKEKNSEKLTLLVKSLSYPLLSHSLDITIQSNLLLKKIVSKSKVVSNISSPNFAIEFCNRESNVLEYDLHEQSDTCIERSVSALNKSNYDERNPIEKSSIVKESMHFDTLEVTDFHLNESCSDNVKNSEINITFNDCGMIRSADFSGLESVSKNGYNKHEPEDSEYVLHNDRHCRKCNHNKHKISRLEKNLEHATFDLTKEEYEETNALSEKDNSDEFSKLSLQFLKNNHTGCDSSKYKDEVSTAEISSKLLAQSELSALNPIPCKYSNNYTAQNTVHEKLQSFPKNISNSKPTCLSCHHLVFFPGNETVNGAKTHDKSSMDCHSQQNNLSNVLSENAIRPSNHQESCSMLEPSNFYSSEITQESAQNTFCNSVTSKQTCINYAYGKINEDGAKVVDHRYHHLFEEEELYELIENNISDLHVLSTFHHESHWCIIAEKVRVWSI